MNQIHCKSTVCNLASTHQTHHQNEFERLPRDMMARSANQATKLIYPRYKPRVMGLYSTPLNIHHGKIYFCLKKKKCSALKCRSFRMTPWAYISLHLAGEICLSLPLSADRGLSLSLCLWQSFEAYEGLRKRAPCPPQSRGEEDTNWEWDVACLPASQWAPVCRLHKRHTFLLCVCLCVGVCLWYGGGLTAMRKKKLKSRKSCISRVALAKLLSLITIKHQTTAL